MKTTLHGGLGVQSPHSSFRILLRSELGARCARNSRYSLRAFAKYLGLDHATLSQLLRGKRRLTERTIRTLGTRLSLSPDQLAGYIANETLDAGPPGMEARLADTQRLTGDIVRLVTEWQHYAILELVRLRDFRPDVRWIARVLDLTPDAITLAVDRLVRLGLLVMESPGRWVDLSGDTVTNLSEFAQVAIQQFATQARVRWLGASHSTAQGPHGSSSTTIAVSTARLGGALQRIGRFRQELLAYLENDPVRDDVYGLEIHLFPLTTLKQANGASHGTSGIAMADRHSIP